MKLFKSIVLAAALVVAAIPASAAGQGSVPVKGHVTDVSGAPLEGVTVMLVGETLVGTVTDAAGDFEMKAPVGAELRITSIGYAEMVVKVTGEPLSIVLKDDTQFLDEVVVVGYGTARKGDLTSQISSVASDKLVERGSAQVSTALQGQIAGVQITRSSGNNASQATIRIHGMTTMSENDPLVIIDGVPGELAYIDAEDIETLSVLKDASAAAIYGARAAAGVILITTKRAKTDQFILDYKYEYSFDRPTARPEKASVVDFLNVFNEVRENDGSGPNSVYSKDFIDNYRTPCSTRARSSASTLPRPRAFCSRSASPASCSPGRCRSGRSDPTSGTPPSTRRSSCTARSASAKAAAA
ncbi:MAG: TonB-dependent receptor plug domain-containing protein [Clostridia bacterium]|nr:TonB-dependent receptor plug domain-containing protein [Clostridia bacterium]